MTYAKASEIVKEYTGADLLESLEQIQSDLEDDHVPNRVRAAYYRLMGGFAELIGTV